MSTRPRTRTLAPAPTTGADTGSPFPDPGTVRSRKVFTEPTAAAPESTEEMRALARTAYIANTAKNKATREEADARKKLLPLMAEAGVTAFSFQTRITGEGSAVKVVGIDVKRAPKQELTVDTELLHRLVGDDLFMLIVSATKGDIEKHAGSVVASQVVGYTQSTTEESVKVTAAK